MITMVIVGPGPGRYMTCHTFLGKRVTWLGHVMELITSSKRCFGELRPPTPENMYDLNKTSMKRWPIIPARCKVSEWEPKTTSGGYQETHCA